MIVRTPRLEASGGQAILTSRFEFHRSGRDAVELRFGVPEELGDRVDQSSNPFVPLAVLVAAHLGENVRFEAPVSPTLLAGAERAAGMFADWWEYRRPRIVAEGMPAGAPGAGNVALLYSRGVDTAATLVRSLRGEIEERVTHLLCGDGIEWVYSAEVDRQIWRDNELAAAEIGLPLVRLTSNSRVLLRGLIGWPRSFGAAYIGSALTLGPMFGQLLTGATQTMDPSPDASGPQPPIADPRGSRWDLDPLWSTEATVVRQDAAEFIRGERIAMIADHEPSVRWLKVCWEGGSAGNCGACMKCLRTMTALASAGVLEKASLFERGLDPAAIRAAPLRNLMPPVIPALAASVPDDLPEIRAAWEEKLDEWRRFERAYERRARRKQRRRRLRRARRRLKRRLRRLLRRP